MDYSVANERSPSSRGFRRRFDLCLRVNRRESGTLGEFGLAKRSLPSLMTNQLFADNEVTSTTPLLSSSQGRQEWRTFLGARFGSWGLADGRSGIAYRLIVELQLLSRVYVRSSNYIVATSSYASSYQNQEEASTNSRRIDATQHLVQIIWQGCSDRELDDAEFGYFLPKGRIFAI